MIEMPEVIFMIKNSADELVTSNGKFAWYDMEQATRIMNLSPTGAHLLRLETKDATPAKTIALRDGAKMVYSIVSNEGIRPMVTSDTKEISMVLGLSKDLMGNQISDYWFINGEGKRAKPEDVIYKMDIAKV